MMYKLFVDSDVVIDFFTNREPHANPASELFELSEQEGLDAIITRNIKDYRNSSIAVMTPLIFLKMKEKNESEYSQNQD
ncbi:MAG: hypothetical protein ACK5IQ_04930 [Bacteroidales bacterium]